MQIDLETLLPRIIEISEIASVEILKYYNTELNIKEKDDHTPVTEADFAAHKTIVNALNEFTPNIPVLSEESISISFDERKSWDTYWLVDPLDGTREFIKKNDEFTVNIALIHQHSPILGVIYIPVTKICYYAHKDCGAFKRVDGSITKITAKKTDLNSIVVAGSRSYRDSSLDNFLSKINQYEIISMGSSIKSCLVAEGKVDIYPRLGPTSEWDTAAAQCIVEEAGGFVTDTELNRIQYNKKESLLNPHFLVFADNSITWNEYL